MSFYKTVRAVPVGIKKVLFVDGSSGYSVDLLTKQEGKPEELMKVWCPETVAGIGDLEEQNIENFEDGTKKTFKIEMTVWDGKTKRRVVGIGD